MRSHIRISLALGTLAAVMTWGALAQDQSPTPPKGLSLAEQGYWILLNKPLAPILMTEADYDNLWKVWPAPLRANAEKATPKERRLLTLERYGFQASPHRPAGSIPQQLTADGKGGLTANCLVCHGGKVAGQVWPGRGNSQFNEIAFNEDVTKYLTQTGRPPPPPPALMPVPASVPVRGLNNAFGEALAFLSVRDRNMDLTLNKLQFTIPPADAFDIPMRTPPYWHAYRKKNFYYDGFVEKSHRDIMQFSFGPTLSGKEARGLEGDFKAIYAWINSVRPPKYRWDVNAPLADEGRTVYLAHCAGCHGKYAPTGYFPEKLIALSDIGTDPLRANLSVPFKKHLGQSWLGYYGKTTVRTEPKGYMAPPLDGVWALAPYLHNGSIPTLWHLLNPDKRPAVWLPSEDGYDQVRVGAEVKEFDRVPDAVQSEQERRLYYQTNLRGLSNQGHRYPPKGLTEAETRSLLEYLKLL